MKRQLPLTLLALIWIWPAQAQHIDGSLSAVWTENFRVGDGRQGWQATAAIGGDHLGLEAAFSSAHAMKAATIKWNRHAILIGPRVQSGGEDLRFYGRWLGGVVRDSLNGGHAGWERGWLAGGGARYALDRNVGLRIGMDYLRGGNLSGVQVLFGLEAGF